MPGRRGPSCRAQAPAPVPPGPFVTAAAGEPAPSTWPQVTSFGRTHTEGVALLCTDLPRPGGVWGAGHSGRHLLQDRGRPSASGAGKRESLQTACKHQPISKDRPASCRSSPWPCSLWETTPSPVPPSGRQGGGQTGPLHRGISVPQTCWAKGGRLQVPVELVYLTHTYFLRRTRWNPCLMLLLRN